MINDRAADNQSMLTLKWPQESKKFLQSVESKFGTKKVVVTGGASFIGSHLVEALLDLDCEVWVVDDLSSGSLDFLPIGHPNLHFLEGNVLTQGKWLQSLENIDFLFHLAAIHGGRGFIESRQHWILQNIRIDNQVFDAATLAGVKRIVYASSACAYPVSQQESEQHRNLLLEQNEGSIRGNKADPDGVYGWTKLLGECQLEMYAQSTYSEAVAARIFTAYGPRENESHAAIALIAKALLKMNPYQIWGNGLQTRNFTYVTDTVCGLLAAAIIPLESKFDILNVGTDQHHTVLDFVNAVFEVLSDEIPPLEFLLSKPTGVASRASNNNKIRKTADWEPSVGLKDGIERTIFWYQNSSNHPKTLEDLQKVLESR